MSEENHACQYGFSTQPYIHHAATIPNAPTTKGRFCFAARIHILFTKTLIPASNDAESFTCGKGLFGTSFPRNLQSGSQPCSKVNSNRFSGGTILLTSSYAFMYPLIQFSRLLTGSSVLGPKRDVNSNPMKGARRLTSHRSRK